MSSTTRLEYAAQLSRSGTVYIKSDSLEFISGWIVEYSAATPVHLVQREWIGETHGRWHI